MAALVASGSSNREAGAELYLSTKAIEYHLGNIFAKLGIRSRHELAARLPAGDPAELKPSALRYERAAGRGRRGRVGLRVGGVLAGEVVLDPHQRRRSTV